MFWTNYVKLCAQIDKAPNVVAAECGVKSTGTVSGWKKGATPRDGVLQKISKYFGVSVDEIIGENEQNNKPAPVVQSEHDKTLEQLLNLAATLDEKDLEMLTDMAKAIKERREKRD